MLQRQTVQSIAIKGIAHVVLSSRLKCNVTSTNKIFHTPLHLAAISEDVCFEVVRNLLDIGQANTKALISSAGTAQLISAIAFASQRVQSLFYSNSDFQAYSIVLLLYCPICVGPGRKRRRPFSRLKCNSISGSSVTSTNKFLHTPLHLAAISGDTCVEVVRNLIDKGAKIEAYNHEHQTPLHKAALYNNLECMRLLIHAYVFVVII